MLALYLSGVSLSLYSRVALVLLVLFNASFSLLTEGEPWPRRMPLPLMGVAMAVPLVFSSGAGAVGSRSFGMALLGGYLLFAFAGLPLSAALGRVRRTSTDNGPGQQ